MNSFLLLNAFAAADGMEALASSEVFRDLTMKWDLNNNCGPRPSGPMYNRPKKYTGKYSDNHECDIMDDVLYISGYKCGGVCQMDKNVEVELYCNCHQQMGPISFIKQCEWIYTNNKKCPKVPRTEQHYDWECAPDKSDCKLGQYSKTTIDKTRPSIEDDIKKIKELERSEPRRLHPTSLPMEISEIIANYEDFAEDKIYNQNTVSDSDYEIEPTISYENPEMTTQDSYTSTRRIIKRGKHAGTNQKSAVKPVVEKKIKAIVSKAHNVRTDHEPTIKPVIETRTKTIVNKAQNVRTSHKPPVKPVVQTTSKSVQNKVQNVRTIHEPTVKPVIRNEINDVLNDVQRSRSNHESTIEPVAKTTTKSIVNKAQNVLHALFRRRDKLFEKTTTPKIQSTIETTTTIQNIRDRSYMQMDAVDWSRHEDSNYNVDAGHSELFELDSETQDFSENVRPIVNNIVNFYNGVEEMGIPSNFQGEINFYNAGNDPEVLLVSEKSTRTLVNPIELDESGELQLGSEMFNILEYEKVYKRLIRLKEQNEVMTEKLEKEKENYSALKRYVSQQLKVEIDENLMNTIKIDEDSDTVKF